MTAQPQSNLLLAAAPIIDSEGNPTTEHFRFLQDQWRKLGGTQSTIPTAVYVAIANGLVVANAAQDNSEIGPLFITGKAGGAAQGIGTGGGSPITFTTPAGGQVVTSSGTLSISRNGGGTYFVVGGGAVGVLTGDKVQVTWTGPAPTIVFLPNQ